MRPKQWTKNGLVFAALIFSKNLTDFDKSCKTVTAFLVFCLLSGSVYLINDLVDRQHDAVHPKKKKRPIAAGRLSAGTGLIFALIIMIGSLGLAFHITRGFFLIAISYLALTLSYSFWLKHLVILDVITIAIGFVIRAVAGAVVIKVELSQWLLLCTFLLAIFLALAKRRNELTLLGETPDNHRPVLKEYSRELLDQMVAIATAATLVVYALYTMDDHTLHFFGTRRLIYTVPFVLYGIYRYLYLTYNKELAGSPEMILLTDIGIVIDVILWIISVGLIIYVF